MDNGYAKSQIEERDELLGEIEKDKERLSDLQNNYQKKLKR